MPTTAIAKLGPDPYDNSPFPFPVRPYRGIVWRKKRDRPDADTIPVKLDYGFEDESRKQLRIDNLYCAEKETAAGKAALADCLRLLPHGTIVEVDVLRTTADTEQRTYLRYVVRMRLVHPDTGQVVDYRATMRALGHDGQGTGSKGGAIDP